MAVAAAYLSVATYLSPEGPTDGVIGQRSRSVPSWPQPQDAAWWNAGQLVLAAIFRRQYIAVWAGRAAHDALAVMAGAGRGFIPRPVVGHRTLHGEHAAVVVGDNEVEWLGGIVSGHGPVCS